MAGNRVALITGGAGFVGSNLAARLLHEGAEVRVLDNLSRRGVEHNLHWLQTLDTPGRLTFIEADIRDARAVREAVQGAAEVYHLAAQVAVTTSVAHPIEDFEVNALGTLHVLEAARHQPKPPFVLFTSTNKVYGSLENVAVVRDKTRYRAADPHFDGVDEDELLDFHSPYGCSKGAADQYVRDYARIYDVPTVVLRMSCIAGPRQFGNEDQGWVAHFLYSVMNGAPITVYGDGLQVRDVLHVDDLLDAFAAAHRALRGTSGEVYNIGGGPSRVVSVIELLRTIEQRTGKPLHLQYAPARPGDQPLYISSTVRFTGDTGWQARRSMTEILGDLERFWHAHGDTIAARLPAPVGPAHMAETVSA